jgi:inorganic pyrophosphatase-like protein/conjugative element/phage-associated large polyvalent protein/RadC-like JAB domain-containing protein
MAVATRGFAGFTDLDPHEEEYIDAKLGTLPEDQIAEDIRQYRAINVANREPDAPNAPDAETDLTPANGHTPTLDEFLTHAKPINRGVSDTALKQFWNEHWGHLDPTSLPTLDAFLPAAQKLNPHATEDDLKTFWDDNYGVFGAREKAPGFGESIIKGLKQGVQQLGSAAAGTFERLQKPTDQWHQIGADTADAFDQAASQLAPPAELANQPWYQRLRNPEYLGNLMGNVAVQSAPSLVGAVAGGMIAGPAGAVAGLLATTYFQQAGSTYRDAYQRYKQDGLEDQAAHEKAYTDSGLAGLVSGVVNSLAVPASLAAPFASTLKNLVLNYVLNVAVDTGDQVTQNIVAKATYNPEQELTVGVPEAVTGSALLSAPETTAVMRGAIGGRAQPMVPRPAVAPPAVTPPGEPTDTRTLADIDTEAEAAQRRAEAAYQQQATRAPTVRDILDAPTIDDAIDTAARVLDAGTTAKRPSFAVPMLPGAEPTGPVTPVEPTQAWMQGAVTPTPPPIAPGQAFTPRAEQEPDYRARLEAERATLAQMRRPAPTSEPVPPPSTEAPTPLQSAAEKAYPPEERTRLKTQQELLERHRIPAKREAYRTPLVEAGTSESPLIQPVPSAPRQAPELTHKERIAAERAKLLAMRKPPAATAPVEAPTPTPVQNVPLRTALSKAYPSVEDIHKLAESRGLAWDNSPVFMEMTKLVTGKSHLDDLTPSERQKMADQIAKIKTTAAPAPTPKVAPAPTQEALSLPKHTEALPTFEAAQVPRGTLEPRQNAEILARAEKAQADLEIAGSERGTRVFTDVPGQGSTQQVTGLKSATAQWYKEATSGPSKLSRQRVDVAVQKILEDKGRDVGQDVQRIKELLLQDQEFYRSEFAPKTEEDWKTLIETATGHAAVEQAAHEAATSPKNALPEPTQPQKDAGNYQKGHIRLAGLEISIENPAGSERSGVDSNGKPWSITMKDHYGYIRGTKGKDKDHIDVFIKPGTPTDYAGPVFVVDQNKPDTNVFDEHKVVMGATSIDEARDLYQQNYAKDWEGLRSIKSFTMPEFKLWLQVGNHQQPAGIARPQPKRETIPPVPETIPPKAETTQPVGEPFALKAETLPKPKAAKPVQQELAVPPETIGTRPIIGREVQPEEAPLFSKAAQTKEAEQTALPETPTEPTSILANALRTAADQIEGKQKIEDVGEKIGGARKDLAEKTGPIGPKQAKPADTVPGWRKRYQVSQVIKSARPGEEGKWSILDTRKEDFAGRPERAVRTLFDTQEAAEAAIPLVAVSRNHRTYKNKDGQWEIYRKIGDRKIVQVVEQTFPTEEAAQRYMAQHAEDIIETKTNFGEEILPRPETVTRTGEDRRQGKNVEANDFKETFDFRGVEFGNWNNQDDRQAVMNHAYDGLLDLAKILKIPPKAIGLNGELALAFGARGHGLSGAAAHYEREYGIINLTKMEGAGHLAHEWFHATDHYFARQESKAKTEKIRNERGDLVYPATTPSGDYVSHGFLRKDSGVRAEVRAVYDHLLQTMFTRAEQYTEDAANVERFVGEARNDVAKQLDAIRNTGWSALSKPITSEYIKRNKAPATAEQLATFDGLAQKILNGEFLSTEFKISDAKNKTRRYLASGRWTNDALEQLSAIHKAVRGRSGWGSGDIRGVFDDLRGYMNRYSERLKMLADAQHGIEKTKQIPTEYAREAKSIDQGRIESYWLTPHEMAARAFAAYVEDTLAAKGQHNDFIAYGTHSRVPTPWGWKQPYPAGEERKAINQAFERLFNTLKTKETESGTAIYEQAAPYGMAVPLSKGVQLLKNERFDLHDIGNRRFMFNPKTHELVLGAEGVTRRLTFASHAEEHEASGAKGQYDDFVKGWIGTSKKEYPHGVIHFSPGVSPKLFNENADYADDILRTLELFARNGGTKKTVIRNGLVPGDQPWGTSDFKDLLALTASQQLLEDSAPYAVREGEQQELNFEMARGALGDLDRAGTDVSTATGAIDRVGGDVRTVALGIAPDLIHQGVVDLTGYAVTNADDLAKLAQVYRDPRFETFRVLYTTRNKIVGHEGLTSRLPGTVLVFRNTADREAKLLAMQSHMETLGADGYYLLHNHPSGNSTPSREDFELTKRYAANLPGFKGHIVIDSNEYAVIDFDEYDDLVSSKKTLNLGPDALLTPSIPHPLLGSTIRDSVDVAAIGQKIKPSADYVTVLYRSGVHTRAIQEMAVAFLSDAARAGPFLRAQAVAFGGQDVLTHYAMQASAAARMPDLLASVDQLIADGVLLDHVTSASSGGSVMGRRDLGVLPTSNKILGLEPSQIVSERVAQVAPYRSRAEHLGELTPAQQTALTHVHGTPTTWREKLNAFKDTWKQTLQQGLFDQYAPILDYSKKAYILSRMTKGGDGTLEALLMYGKPYVDSEGAYRVDYREAEGMNGFSKVLAGLKGEQDRFLEWVAAQRADRLKGIGLEHLYSEEDIATLKTLNRGTMPDGTAREAAYLTALRELNNWNDAMVKIGMDSGLLDPEVRDLFKDQPYVPFYRLHEEGVTPGFGIKPGLVNQYAWKKLTGGTEHLNDDLLANLLQNWSHIITASAKNRAAKETLTAAELAGVAEQVPSGSPEKGLVHYMDQGKPVTFRVTDPALLDAIAALHYAGLGAVAKPFQAMKRYFSFAVTVNPTYKIRNLIRDSIQAIGTADLSYNPLKNIAQGAKATRMESETRAQLLAGGGMVRFGTMLDGNNADRTRRLIEQGVDATSILSDANAVTKFWKQRIQPAFEAYQEFGDRGEQVNRAALYEQLLAKGMTHQEATFWARDLMDFSMSGKWAAVRILTQVVPFFSARLQGLYKLGRATAADYKRMGGTLAAVSLASIALMLAYKDDDDWKRREDYDRENYWWFRVGGLAVRIPKPFELGAIGTIAERSAELLASQEMTGKRFGERLAATVSNQLSMNPTPQLIKPLMDLYANKDAFTGRPIEMPGMERLRKSERLTEKTSEVARLLGSLGLPDPTQLAMGRWEGLSPVQIDALVRGYLSWLGSTATTVLDYGIRPLVDRGTRPNLALKDVFLAGNFVETLPSGSSRYLTQFYDQALDVEQAYGSFRDALKRGDQQEARSIREQEREKLSLYPLIERVKREESAVNTRIKLIEQSRTLSGADKRVQIDRLREQKSRLAKIVSDRQLALQP